jgi:hypothetical protein
MKRWNLTARVVALGVVALALGGCGPKVITPVPVQGTVSLDNKPLAEGRITFITPGQVPELLEIVDGRFEGQVKPGEKRVEIAAYRPVRIPPQVPKSMHSLIEPGEENYLPARYHSNSTLVETVKESGGNEFRFELTSK